MIQLAVSKINRELVLSKLPKKRTNIGTAYN